MSPEPAVLVERLGPDWLLAAARGLPPEEEARALRFHRSIDRDTWRAGRAWVRHHLSAALDRPPASITLVADARGRPHLTGAPPGFDCNWSHSGSWIALAVSWHGPVGIDVEAVRADFPVSEVAPTVCTDSERAALAATVDAVDRTRLFYRLWTAKESLMKATGLGAALEPARIEVRLHDGRPSGYASHPGWSMASREDGDWVATWTWAAQIPRP